MSVIQPTPDHVLDKATIEQLKRVNTTAVVDVLARNGYEPHYVYMPNVRTMNPGQRLVARAITVRFVPARPGDYIVADDDGVVVIPRGVAPEIALKAIEYDDLEEWIRARLDKEQLTPGLYYPPDDEVIAMYRKEKAENGGS